MGEAQASPDPQVTVITQKVPTKRMYVCTVARGGREVISSGHTRREATKRALRLWNFKFRGLAWKP